MLVGSDDFPMAVTLIVVGVGLLLAAILGGSVEVWKIKIPEITSSGRRITVGILGVFLLGTGFWMHLPDSPPNRSQDTTVVTPKTDGSQQATTHPLTTAATLAGTVGLSHHAAAFRERHADYSITAVAPSTAEYSARLDDRGQFRFADVPEAPVYTVSWGVSRPSDFAIWPLVFPRVRPGEELRGFRFQRLHDVFVNEQRRMFETVTNAKFGEANERLSTMLQLFDRLGVRDAPTDDPIANQMRRWRFTIHRDLAKAAYDFRDRFGRSKITDKQVKTERTWRRTMINAALEQPAVAQGLRDFARSANSWATYSR